MKSTDIPRIRAWFKEYSEGFLGSDDAFNANIQLKIDHSYRVLERMSEIADDLNLKNGNRRIALSCALLHDAGRFEQLKRYNTFADTQSENHGSLGAEVLKQAGILDELSPRAAEILITAVKYHNSKFLPDSLTAEQRYFSELTRDADKIDILKVVSDYYLDDSTDKDPMIVHNLPDEPRISDDVFEEYMSDGHVTFDKMQTVADFKLFQMGWVRDINTASALKILHRLGYIEKIISTLSETDRAKEAAALYYDYISVVDADKRLSWTEKSRKKLQDCRIFSVYSSHRVSSEGKEAAAYMLEAPDWVTVVPKIVKDGTEYFVMVRQYRHGSMQVTTEFPAGTVEPGEEPEVAALRELQEETGYKAGKITWLGSVNPNPAFMTNKFTAFLAEDLESTGVQNLDEHEYVDFELIPAEDVIKRLGSGSYNNGTMLMALLYYLRETGKIV